MSYSSGKRKRIVQLGTLIVVAAALVLAIRRLEAFELTGTD